MGTSGDLISYPNFANPCQVDYYAFDLFFNFEKNC